MSWGFFWPSVIRCLIKCVVRFLCQTSWGFLSGFMANVFGFLGQISSSYYIQVRQIIDTFWPYILRFFDLTSIEVLSYGSNLLRPLLMRKTRSATMVIHMTTPSAGTVKYSMKSLIISCAKIISRTVRVSAHITWSERSLCARHARQACPSLHQNRHTGHMKAWGLKTVPCKSELPFDT